MRVVSDLCINLAKMTQRERNDFFKISNDKGAKQVAGLGRLGCYQGLYYLNKLLEEDKYYSEKLEDSIVFIESHINRIEKENKKYKEVIDKAIEYIKSYKTDYSPYELSDYNVRQILDILKGV